MLVPITAFMFCLEGIFLIFTSIKQCEVWSGAYHLLLPELLDKFYSSSYTYYNLKFYKFPFNNRIAELEFRMFYLVFCDQYHIQRSAFPFDEYVQRIYVSNLIVKLTLKLSYGELY